MARKKWNEAKGKRDRGGFLTIPFSVLESKAYISANPYARMLLFDLALQYRGDNNGETNLRTANNEQHENEGKSPCEETRAERFGGHCPI